MRRYHPTYRMIREVVCEQPPKRKNHGTQDSRVVPHRGTNWAALRLTAQIERDAVLSESYGRGYHTLRRRAYMSSFVHGLRILLVEVATPKSRLVHISLYFINKHRLLLQVDYRQGMTESHTFRYDSCLARRRGGRDI